MVSLSKSITTRLALGYAVLVAEAILVASGVFYFGTIGVMDRRVDGKITAISNRLMETFQNRPVEELARQIELELNDGIDSDTEIFLVVSPSGQRVVGNLTAVPEGARPLGQVVTGEVVRGGKRVSGRLIARQLPDGGFLYVGRDLSEQRSVRDLVVRALAAGAGASLVVLAAGALLFRHQIEKRIGRIRRTAGAIEAGDLKQRIPVTSDDEFGRLSVDINRMLDRIGQLVDGVRHVSNAIAHDLRTPLGRIRNKLDEAVRHGTTAASSEAATAAIEDIDQLILVFEKLLQIAEAESGVRARSFEAVDLNRIANDMVELYDATAEQQQVSLKPTGSGAVLAAVDRNLLASAVASLIDNAIKYAGPGATIEVGAYTQPQSVAIEVRDNGPGIPAPERPKVTERFYRLDQSRNLPGNGLGLSIVSAIATLHGGALQLEDASPGLLARIVLPIGPAVQAVADAATA
ncbi:MAG TPA: HAMP domain-containing sensor histidine kinase [Burkholderiaceae bacterium]|nr:HAMP domain-containing sensor histidine kinase [Burkholderiaceae bacterium]